jgi:hypothetical protein
MSAVLLVCLHLLAFTARAGLPEPGLIVFGQVEDSSGEFIPSGRLMWTFTPVGNPAGAVSLAVDIEEWEYDGIRFSYSAMLGLEKYVTGFPTADGFIPIPAEPVMYIWAVRVKDTQIAMTGYVEISRESRGASMMVNLQQCPKTAEDTDGDCLPDAWEQEIIDADPNDNIKTLNDVDSLADYDGDGFNNLSEFEDGTDPLDPADTPMQVIIPGDLNGDGHINLEDALWGLRVVINTSLNGTRLEADVNADGKIDLRDVIVILEITAGLR